MTFLMLIFFNCLGKIINLRMSNNFIAKKNSENAKLLTLLTNRERAKSVPNLRKDWPGKTSPNFALTARLTRTSVNHHPPSSIKLTQKAKQSLIVTKDLPSVRIPLYGNLQLKPCFANTQSFTKRASLTSRKTLTHNSTRKSGVFKIQQNEDTKSVVSIFRNSKIANKVSEIIDHELNDPSKQNHFQQNWEKVLKKKTLIALKTGSERKKSTLNEREEFSKKEEKTRFKIDYLAFGYIEKVIENPQLWEKYVHKIQNNKANPYLTEA